MSRVQTKYKVCRRLGPGVYDKCQTEQFAVREQRRRPARGRRTNSDYNTQLLEKQKVRFTYGMNEKQFHNYVKDAAAVQGMTPAERLYQQLESRLDNVVYRVGLAPTRAAARQMVSHGHVFVDGKRIKVPSHQVRLNQAVSVRPGSKDKGMLVDFEERFAKMTVPAWINFDGKKTEATKIAEPDVAETQGLYDFTGVIAFYSR